jgi:hypothetical protein
MTGNGNQGNLLKIDWRKTWNHIKWTYFWRILAVWNNCASGCSVAVIVCRVQNSYNIWILIKSLALIYEKFVFILYHWADLNRETSWRFLQGRIEQKNLSWNFAIKTGHGQKIIVLIFAMGKTPLTHWRHYDVIRDKIVLILSWKQRSSH